MNLTLIALSQKDRTPQLWPLETKFFIQKAHFTNKKLQLRTLPAKKLKLMKKMMHQNLKIIKAAF
jgi:hypothetical protein